MYKKIKIGEQEMDFLGTAATNIYYKRIFGEDPIELQENAKKASQQIDLYCRLAYIMHEQARHCGDREGMMKINEDTYVEWLDTFDFGDLQDALGQISEVYLGQQKPMSSAKKK